MDLAALGHVGSSRTRDRTGISCIGGWILIHCTIREVHGFDSKDNKEPSEDSKHASDLAGTKLMACGVKIRIGECLLQRHIY